MTPEQIQKEVNAYNKIEELKALNQKKYSIFQFATKKKNQKRKQELSIELNRDYANTKAYKKYYPNDSKSP